jgi:hypothetical protein
MLAIAFLGERAGWKTLASIALATAGIVVIGFDPLVFGQLDVLALSLISAFFQALGSVFMRRVHGIGMLGFQAWSAVFVLPILGLLWGPHRYSAPPSAFWCGVTNRDGDCSVVASWSWPESFSSHCVAVHVNAWPARSLSPSKDGDVVL